MHIFRAALFALLLSTVGMASSSMSQSARTSAIVNLTDELFTVRANYFPIYGTGNPDIAQSLNRLVGGLVKLVMSDQGTTLDFTKITNLTREQKLALVMEIGARATNPEAIIQLTATVLDPQVTHPLVVKLIGAVTTLDEATQQDLDTRITGWLVELNRHKELIPDPRCDGWSRPAFMPLMQAVNQDLRHGAVVGLVSLMLNTMLSHPGKYKLASFVHDYNLAAQLFEEALGHHHHLVKPLKEYLMQKYAMSSDIAIYLIGTALFWTFAPAQ